LVTRVDSNLRDRKPEEEMMQATITNGCGNDKARIPGFGGEDHANPTSTSSTSLKIPHLV
jgi:hypothetical protein